MLKKKFEIFEIEYNENDSEYIDNLINYLKENYKKIMEFFEIKNYDKNIKIKIWDSKESYRDYFNKKYKKYGYNKTVAPWEVGRTHIDEYPRIDLILYKESLECQGHQNDTIDNYIQMVLHEFVHVCHFIYNKETTNVTWFSEGLATNLSHQSVYINNPLTLDASLDEITNGKVFYQNYYAMVNYLLNNYSREEILELVKNKELLIKETPEIYEQTKMYINNIKHKKKEK